MPLRGAGNEEAEIRSAIGAVIVLIEVSILMRRCERETVRVRRKARELRVME